MAVSFCACKMSRSSQEIMEMRMSTRTRTRMRVPRTHKFLLVALILSFFLFPCILFFPIIIRKQNVYTRQIMYDWCNNGAPIEDSIVLPFQSNTRQWLFIFDLTAASNIIMNRASEQLINNSGSPFCSCTLFAVSPPLRLCSPCNSSANHYICKDLLEFKIYSSPTLPYIYIFFSNTKHLELLINYI